MTGRGEFPDPGVFEYIQTHFLEEPARSRFGDFWLTAEALAGLPNRSLIGALPQAYAHCLRESLDEIAGAGRTSGSRWRDVSRSVVEASERFKAIRGLPGEDEEGALNELVDAIEQMAAFHSDVPADIRDLTNLIYVKTGARLIGLNPHPAKEFRDVKKELASLAHSSGGWEKAFELRDRAVYVLRRLFKPPDEHIDAIRTLARDTLPSEESIAQLESSITNEHHLRFFLTEIPDPTWVTALGTSEIVAPSTHGGAWPGTVVVRRFADDYPSELRDWLSLCYERWNTLPGAPGAFATSARELGQTGNELMLRVLKEYPEDSQVAWQAFAAVENADPSDPFVSQIAELLLASEEPE